MHWRALLDPGVYVGPQDFPADKTVAISRVVREAMPSRDKDEAETSAPMMYFAPRKADGSLGAEIARKYKAPKSVMYGLSLTFGTETDAWIGKDVTLFATKCMSFGEVEECVRIRFAPEVDRKIKGWLKKRKSSPKAYMLEGA
jgi:hypothetical protein